MDNEGIDLHCIYITTRHPSYIYFNEWDVVYDESRIDFLRIEDAPEENIMISRGEWEWTFSIHM